MRRRLVFVGILVAAFLGTTCGRQAVHQAAKECSAGDQAACARLAAMYRKGDGVGKDSAKAAGLFSDACARREMAACFDLAEMHWRGEVTGWYDIAKGSDAFVKGVDIDKERAVAVHQKVCDGGDAEACSHLGLMYLAGRGVERDDAKA